jgi:hypothetical protein
MAGLFDPLAENRFSAISNISSIEKSGLMNIAANSGSANLSLSVWERNPSDIGKAVEFIP